MDFVLRPYQEHAIELIRTKFANRCRKVLLYGMTGFGKTEVFCYIADQMGRRGKTCFVVTRGRELVHNAYDRLIKRGVDAGIIMAAHEYVLDKMCYVISIDTLLRRSLDLKHPDLLIIDEAHFGSAPSFVKLANAYPDAFYLGVTATPWPEKSIKHIAEHWVAPITYDALVSQGFLVPSKVYAPLEVDLAGVKTKAGDYSEPDLYGAMDKRHIYGNILSNYVSVTSKAPAFCFCVNVAHSKNMADMFNANGIRARHLDADSPDDDRKETLALLERGEIDVITNCNILSTGVDVPRVAAIISARPTQSRILWVQQAGRGSRPFDGKGFFYLMDHANNTRVHGFIEDFIEPMLDGRPKGSRAGAAPVKTCPECFMVLPVAIGNCPCGHEFVRDEAEKLEVSAEIAELERRLFTDPIAKDAADIIRQCYIRGYKRGSIYMRLKDRHGERSAKKFSTRDFVERVVAQIEQDRAREGLEKLGGFGSYSPGTNAQVRAEGLQRYSRDYRGNRENPMHRDQDGECDPDG